MRARPHVLALIGVASATTVTTAEPVVPLVTSIEDDFPQAASTWGSDLDASGPFIAIGAARFESNGEDVGAVFVYRRTAAGDWVFEAPLLPPPEDIALPYWTGFGDVVALDGGVLAVGAPASDGVEPQAGAVHIFTRSNEGWTLSQKLVAPDGETGDAFGFDISISGSTMLVGAISASDGATNPGRVYVFEENADATWSWTASIDSPPGGSRFGWSVDLDGALGVIGEPRNTGSRAHIVKRGATDWTITDTLIPNGDRFRAEIGADVDIEGTRVVVGGPNAETVPGEVGGAFIYDVDAAGDATLVTPIGPLPGGSGPIGVTVAIAQNLVVLGGRDGSNVGGNLYMYEETSPGVWERITRLIGEENYGEPMAFESPLLYTRGDGMSGGPQTVGVHHLGQLIGLTTLPSPQPDRNGDGVVDGADLGVLLGEWGAMTR